MPTRKAHARWEGAKQGRGRMDFGRGAFEGAYSFGSRFEEAPGTNPEELLAAAHAGCFSMALALALGQAGHDPEYVDVTAHVTVGPHDGGFRISKSHLVCEAHVPSLDPGEFQRIADEAKANCPVSKALAGVDITLEARLTS